MTTWIDNMISTPFGIVEVFEHSALSDHAGRWKFSFRGFDMGEYATAADAQRAAEEWLRTQAGVLLGMLT